jgi:hemolysin activation/secretion protein
VHIRIVEGFIDHVTVSGDPKGARALLQSYGEKIAQSRPLQMKTIEHYLLLANAIPGVTVKAVLEPSKTVTGASDLTLTTDTKTLSGFASYDNYGTRYIGPTEVTVGGQMNSIFRPGDKTQITVAGTDKNNALRYIDISHDTPLGSSGLRLILDGNYTETQPKFVLKNLDVMGRSKNASATLKYPLLLSRAQNINLQAGFNYLDSKVSILTVPIYMDHIRKAVVGGTYDFSDSWHGANLIGLTISQGLNVMGATQDNDPDISRTGGHSIFTKYNMQISRLQPIYGRFSAFALAQGQYTKSPLLTSEQFGFGGQQVGRGYDSSEIIGDKGVAGSMELRMDMIPARKFFQATQLYVFYDVGKIWNNKNLGQVPEASGASTGGGMRMFFTHYLSGNLLIAKPLTRPVAAENINRNGKAPRVFFGITASV